MTDAVLTLARSATAWNSPAFRLTLIDEIQTLGPEHSGRQPLLQAGLLQTSTVADVARAVHLLSSREQDGHVQVHLGVFYGGIIAGCSCADDPSPVDTITEHCELLVDIDLATGLARATPCDRQRKRARPLPGRQACCRHRAVIRSEQVVQATTDSQYGPLRSAGRTILGNDRIPGRCLDIVQQSEIDRAAIRLLE
jgi:hypothetical protein